MNQLPVGQQQWAQAFHSLGWGSPLDQQTWEKLGGGPGYQLDWATVAGLIQSIGWSEEHARALWMKLSEVCAPQPAAPAEPVAPPVDTGNPWSSNPFGEGMPAGQPAGMGFSGQPSGPQPAGWWRRFGSYIIDALIVLVPNIIVAIPLLGIEPAALQALILYGIVQGAIWAVYCRLTMLRQGERAGQTVGMQTLGIRIVSESGAALDFRSILMRQWLGFLLLGWVMPIILMDILGPLGLLVAPLWIIGWFIVLPLVDKQNRCPHDMIAGTKPVQEQKN